MAAPVRTGTTPPPALHDRALQDLSFIRRTMENASSFTDVPGWGLVAVGCTAMVAAVIAARQTAASYWLTVWLLEAVVAGIIGSTTMWRKMRRRVRAEGAPVLSAPARKFLFGFWPAIFAGAVITFAVLDVSTLTSATPQSAATLPGVWLMLYGVGVMTAGAFSVRAVPLMGAVFMLLGTVALLARTVPGDVFLAIGFGVVQIVFGFWIARNHGG
ncbi:MAG: hypothetical protein IT353_24330 [Gemmatimonadaceae bacterium]|nr:hypothetical protein [Gemmatimonadaceae bacterium]